MWLLMQQRSLWGWFLAVMLAGVFSMPFWLGAQQGMLSYSNTLSSSAPGLLANHTYRFTANTNVPSGGMIRIRLPADWSLQTTSGFTEERNVDLRINGAVRTIATTSSPTADMVEFDTSAPEEIRYILAAGLPGIANGDTIELRIGNHTALAIQPGVATSTITDPITGATSTATTTIVGDSPGILNPSATGTHRIPVALENSSGSVLAEQRFVVFINEQVGVGPVDTTSDIPAELSEGRPTSTVSGVVTGVQVSVRTNKFAYCRYSTTPDVDFFDMSNEFDRGGDFWVIHTFTIPEVQPNEEYEFYIRCIDLEDNVNPEDYPIIFNIGEPPTGEPNPDGQEEGDGSGPHDPGDTAGGDEDAGEGQEDSAGSGEQDTDTAGPPGGGGGGGGGSGGGGGGSSAGGGGGFESEDGPFESGDGRVIFNGFAQPRSEIVVLVDGQEAIRGTAQANGRYSITLDGIARGVYTFGVYGIDQNGVRSSTFSTSFTVSGARVSALSNVNVPPSLSINPDPVDPGTDVTLSGFTVPNSEVTLEHEREGSVASRQTFTITSDQNGRWEQVLDTGGFTTGPHQARARVITEEFGQSNFSNFVRYGVGEEISDTLHADLNRDGRVNLVDFSILLFWWGTDGGDSDPPADINQDGVVNLVDFSILLFNWTG